jgi:hypothetical protein
MVMAEERKKVLEMLRDGSITAEMASGLLESLDETVVGTPEEESAPRPVAFVPAPPEPSSGRAHWLRVRVTDTDSGRSRVNLRLPVLLVNLGLRLGSKYTPEIDGINMSELLQTVQLESRGTFIDVYDEEEGEHVEVFLE